MVNDLGAVLQAIITGKKAVEAPKAVERNYYPLSVEAKANIFKYAKKMLELLDDPEFPPVTNVARTEGLRTLIGKLEVSLETVGLDLNGDEVDALMVLTKVQPLLTIIMMMGV